MPESTSKSLPGLGKSVLLGGGASGVLSIFPGLNLLNLFFMAWILLGAGLTIHLLYRQNPTLRRLDALLAGALSGLFGGGIFTCLGLVTVIGITQEKLDRIVESARAMAPFLAGDQSALVAGSQLKALMLMAIGLFLLLAILAGALSGLISRGLLRPDRGGSR